MLLQCNECGHHNGSGASKCTKCGDSLEDEKAEDARRNLPVLLMMSFFILGTSFFVPGWLVRVVAGLQTIDTIGSSLWLTMSEMSDIAYWSAYGACWLVLLFVSKFFRPKERYDLTSDHYGSLSWNPFRAYNQSRDRAHLVTGLIFFPFNVSREVVLEIWCAVKGTRQVPRGPRRKG